MRRHYATTLNIFIGGMRTLLEIFEESARANEDYSELAGLNTMHTNTREYSKDMMIGIVTQQAGDWKKNTSILEFEVFST